MIWYKSTPIILFQPLTAHSLVTTHQQKWRFQTQLFADEMVYTTVEAEHNSTPTSQIPRSTTRIGQSLRQGIFHRISPKYINSKIRKLDLKAGKPLPLRVMQLRGKNPFQCLQRNKKFSQRRNLVTHQNTHTGKKHYSFINVIRNFHKKRMLWVINAYILRRSHKKLLSKYLLRQHLLMN